MTFQQIAHRGSGKNPEAGPQPTTSPGDGRQAPLHGVPTLVVEDDPASAKLHALLLRNAGASVTVAPTAEAALQSLKVTRPRLIVLDLVLPRMSGLLFLEHLRADSQNRGIVVVAVTAINGSETRRMVRAAGCAGYFRKPVDTETFALTIASFLGAHS